MDQIFGYIERITFHNPENGYTVARLKQPRKSDLTTIVGNLPGIQAGESVRCLGAWKNNPTHGLQFAIEECHLEAPSDVLGIQKYLASGMVKGIGPKYAERIVNKFKEETLEIIDKHPNRLLKVEGIGKKRVETIKKCWSMQKSIREVMVFLQKYGVSPAYAQKIYRTFGDEAIDCVKENPFALAQKIAGIGFKMADTIAENMGFPKEGTQRIDSGIEYVLIELSGEGHVCAPKEEFLTKAEEILGVSREKIEERIQVLIGEEKIFIDEEFLFAKGLYLAEKGIARELARLQQERCNLRTVDTEKAVEWAQERLKITLAENQKEAVKKSLSEKVHIITGGPGTGKSTITKAILAVTSKLTHNIILAAPTGRAAKRMSEITRRSASTIHSLLKYDFKAGGFQRNRENPLECDLIIVDEASMIDTSLMYHLLRAIPGTARLVFVGDIYQLPSVGPGNVLKDMIESETIPVTCLTEIYRQAAGSRIITNAHKINAGEFPDIQTDYSSDFFFVRAEEPEEIVEKILNLVSERLPKRYRLDPINAIQVLAPMKKGIIGIENLNHRLQEKLNPATDVILQPGDVLPW